jgi:hypothetical protein
VAVGVLGQQVLFGEPSAPPVGTMRFALSLIGRRCPWSSSLPLVVAQARAAALAGYRAVILGTDGCAVRSAAGSMASS